MSTVVSPDHQYQFDSIIVTPKSQLPKHLHGESAVIFHDKKKIYAGPNANWTLKLKDLNKVEVSTRDVYDDNRGRSRSIGRGGRGGGHSETLTLALVGKKMQILCTTTTGNRTALAAKQLESFIEGLKNVHRKVKVKEGDKDPYAFEDEHNKRKNFANTTKSRSSSLGRSKKAYGHRGGSTSGSARVTQVTPHTTTSVYMSPSKKRSTSGAFHSQSPARNRSISFGDQKNQKQQQQYAHFNPDNNDNEGSAEESYVTGNVVHEPESPAVRKLNLAPKSPRNATPTKLRSILSDEAGGRGRTPLVANQLNGISGGNIKLRKKITFDLDLDQHGSDDENEFKEERVELKEKGADKKMKLKELEDSEGEDEAVPKRRRLKKISSGTTTKDEDSDVEFDTLGGDDDRVEATPASSCKKKLRLSSGDEDEDEDEEGVANKASSDKEGSVVGEVESSSVSSAPSSPTKKPKSTATKTSVADAALAPSPAKTKKGSIHNFFAPKQSSNKAISSSAKPKEAKRSSPPDTYGAIMSTPSKKARSEGTSPSTPPHRTDCSKPTPVSKMTQRKNASRYFSSVSNVNKGLAENEQENIGGNTLKYSSEEEDIVPGYRDEYYNKDDNENDKEEGEEDEENGHAGEQTAYEKMGYSGGRRGVYGRAGAVRRGRGWSGTLGQSRLASRGPQSRIQQRKMESRMSPNRGKLDFSGFKAGTRFSPKVTSTADRALSRKDSWEKLPPLVPINEADKTFKPAASTPSIPGVQNLGNTCYLSASLQTLFSIPDFISDLYNTYATFATTTPSKKMPLTQALLEIAVVIGVVKNEDAPLISPDVAKGKPINNKAASVAAEPVELKKQMDVLTNKFAGYEQRDAHEFLSDLIDFLHDELAASPSVGADPQTNALVVDGRSGEDDKPATEDENKNPNQSPVKAGEEKEAGKSNAPDTTASTENVVLPTDEYFRLNVRVCLECDSCGYSRSKDEMYRHLSVDVGEDTELDKWSVERSLQQFFQPEKRELKCEKCDSGRTATQTMGITSCPKALLLHFKRFIVTQEMKGAIGSGNSDGKENNSAPPPRMEMVLKKNKAKIPLEESLSINPFVGKDEESPSEKYHLRGVVHHLGITAFSGHYTACAKKLLAKPNNPSDNEEQWVFFDDRVGVKKDTEYVTGSDRNQRNCYMALYELK